MKKLEAFSNLFQLGVVVVVDVADVDVADGLELDASDAFHDGTFGFSSVLDAAAVVVDVEVIVDDDDGELPYDDVLPLPEHQSQSLLSIKLPFQASNGVGDFSISPSTNDFLLFEGSKFVKRNS